MARRAIKRRPQEAYLNTVSDFPLVAGAAQSTLGRGRCHATPDQCRHLTRLILSDQVEVFLQWPTERPCAQHVSGTYRTPPTRLRKGIYVVDLPYVTAESARNEP